MFYNVKNSFLREVISLYMCLWVQSLRLQFLSLYNQFVVHIHFQFACGNGLFFQFSGSLKGYCILFDKFLEQRSKNMTIWPGILWNMYHTRSTVVTLSPSLCWSMLNRTTSPTSFSSMGSLDCSFRWNFFPLHISIEFHKWKYFVIFRRHDLCSHLYHVV